MKSWWAATISASQLQKTIILNCFSRLWMNLIVFKNYPVNWHQRQNRRVSLFRKSTQLTAIEEIIGRNEWITNLFGNIGWNLNQQLSLDKIVVLRSIFHTNSSHTLVIFVPTKIVEIKCRSEKNTLLPKKLLIFVNFKHKIQLVMNLKRGSFIIHDSARLNWTSFQSFSFKSI